MSWSLLCVVVVVVGCVLSLLLCRWCVLLLCLVVCCAVCCVVLCCVCCVCAVVVVVWCETRKNPVCTFKASPCVPTTRLHMVNTCGRVAGTHGDVLNAHTGRGRGGSLSVLLTKNCPRKVITCPRGSTMKPVHVTNFQSENRSRTTRCRVLHLFASPEHTVQLQTHDTTTHIDTHTQHNDTQQRTTTRTEHATAQK